MSERTRQVDCEICHGWGFVETFGHRNRCMNCGGSGFLNEAVEDGVAITQSQEEADEHFCRRPPCEGLECL